jgi:hypothetical protein
MVFKLPTFVVLATVTAAAALPVGAYLMHHGAGARPTLAPNVTLAPAATSAPHSPAMGPAQAARAGARALFAAKRDFASKCWAPQSAARPQPAGSRHRVRETFDGAGKEVRREVLDLPGESRADVGDCLRDLPLELHTESSGVPATVEVTLAFP